MPDPNPGRRWTVRRSRHIHRSPWIGLRADDCVTASGVEVAPYYLVETPDFVHVLALDEAGRVVLVRQYRHGLGALSLELPGGNLEPGEPAEDAVLATGSRELREETGYAGGRWERLACLSPDPARYTNRVHLVRARGVVAGNAEPDAAEDIEVVLVEPDEAIRLALEGGVANAVHVALILLGLRGEGPAPSARSRRQANGSPT